MADPLVSTYLGSYFLAEVYVVLVKVLSGLNWYYIVVTEENPNVDSTRIW